MQYNFHPRLFNPLFWHLLPLLRDPNIRYIYIEGGSSASKTFSVCQALLYEMYGREFNTLVFREQLVDVKDSVFGSFRQAASKMEMTDYWQFIEHKIKSKDEKCFVRFRGLDDEENIKGIEEFDVVYLNEFSQNRQAVWNQLRLRLRGRLNQKFVADWNPVDENMWHYTNLLDIDRWSDMPLELSDADIESLVGKHTTTTDGKLSAYEEVKNFTALNPEYAFKKKNEAGDSVWMKITYRDNWYVSGHPSGKGGFLDTHTLAYFSELRDGKEYMDAMGNITRSKPNMNYYRIYANGERGVSNKGGEFWKSFDVNTHVKKVELKEGYPIAVSCDQNSLPYVTLSCWQFAERDIIQVKEFACKSPDNNAVKSAQQFGKWLKEINYLDTVYVFGDPSGSNSNTIDENNKSWYDKFIGALRAMGFTVKNCVAKAHPAVGRSAEYINAIYERNEGGYSITIGANCPLSINDYQKVKEGEMGTMLKVRKKDKETGQTYEEHGHFSDAKRYVIIKLTGKDFEDWLEKDNKEYYIESY